LIYKLSIFTQQQQLTTRSLLIKMLSNENSTLNADAVAWMPIQQVYVGRVMPEEDRADFESLRVMYSQDYSASGYSETESDNYSDDDIYNDTDIGNDYENEPRPDYDEINYRIWEDENERSSALDHYLDQDQDQMEEDPYYASIDALLEEIARIDVFMETRREDIWLLNYLKDTRDSDVSVVIDPSDNDTCWV
jgi:hypothetical protein